LWVMGSKGFSEWVTLFVARGRSQAEGGFGRALRSSHP
jgi:hypothetical protein